MRKVIPYCPYFRRNKIDVLAPTYTSMRKAIPFWTYSRRNIDVRAPTYV